jgi:hypothetical protein
MSKAKRKSTTPRRHPPARKFAPHHTVAALWAEWSALEAKINTSGISDKARNKIADAVLPRQKQIMRQIAATKCTTTEDLITLGDVFALWMEQPPMRYDARPMVARFKADVLRLVPRPADDIVLLARAAEFHAAYKVSNVAWRKAQALRAKADARRDCPQDRSSKAWEAFMDKHGVNAPWDEAQRLLKQSGKAAQLVINTAARTPAGVAAKLRIVQLAYGTGTEDGDADLEAYQRGSWLGSAIKDLERLAGKGGAA